MIRFFHPFLCPIQYVQSTTAYYCNNVVILATAAQISAWIWWNKLVVRGGGKSGAVNMGRVFSLDGN